jgi:CRP/FNR family transcriptional regulator
MEYFSLQELGLPEDIWAPFRTARQAQHYAAGQLIYLQDTPAEGFYYLLSGRVNAFLSSEEGDERVLAVYQSGNLFGEASFFNELPRVSSAITVTECDIVFISRSTAQTLLSENPQLAMALLKYLARTVWMLSILPVTASWNLQSMPPWAGILPRLWCLLQAAAVRCRCPAL